MIICDAQHYGFESLDVATGPDGCASLTVICIYDSILALPDASILALPGVQCPDIQTTDPLVTYSLSYSTARTA